MSLKDSDKSDSESEECPSQSENEEELLLKKTEQVESSSNYSIWIAVTIIVAIMLPLFLNYSTFVSESRLKCLRNGERLFDRKTLAKYKDGSKVYLAFLGVVYDVSAGDYYRPGGGYHFFAGIDGTRAFLNGEFVEAELRDDILDLDDSHLTGVKQWRDLYESKYKRIGVLIGSYFDSQACPKKTLEILEQRLLSLKNAEMSEKDEHQAYPPCNFEWSQSNKQGRLWCSKSSGGIQRSWTGVPRNMRSRVTKQWRCACLQNGDRDIEDQLCLNTEAKPSKSKKKQNKATGVQYADEPDCTFKHYPNCDLNSIECNYT